MPIIEGPGKSGDLATPKFRDGVLYAAEFELGRHAQPVRVLDHRRWLSFCSPTLNSFKWRLATPVDDRRFYRATVGVACLYWSNTPAEPASDPWALLDFPWEPLPEDSQAAARELSRRANGDITATRSKQARGAWLCLRPVARHQIVCPWDECDVEKVQADRRLR
ncbi:hypothetical protein AB0P21_41060 [Kribbella sp. NPDC056861]|uniref:hypothetical protein n=1 Tax=Kribbella sp. NPDC056861 TaxID=3154857 RepID=UPI003416BC3C